MSRRKSAVACTVAKEDLCPICKVHPKENFVTIYLDENSVHLLCICADCDLKFKELRETTTYSSPNDFITIAQRQLKLQKLLT